MSCSSASLVLSCFISPLSLSEFSKIILVLQAITVWGRQCMSFWASCCSHLGNKYTKDWALWLCYKFWSKSWNGTEFLLVPSVIPHSLNATTQCIQKMVPTCNMWMLSMHVLLFANWHIYCATLKPPKVWNYHHLSWPVDGKKSIWFLNEWGATSVAPDCESELKGSCSKPFVRLS